MRISFVTPYCSISGGIKIIQGHALRLAQRGHDVFIISQPAPKISLREKWRALKRGEGWRTVPPELPFPNHPRITHKRLSDARPVTSADLPDADVVIATWWETANWVAELSPNKGAKCYFVQADERMFFPPDYHDIREQILATWRLPLHMITISNVLADGLRSQGVTEIDMVTNPVELADFNASPRTKQLAPTVGTLHSEAAAKGSDIAYEAMRIAQRTIPNLHARCFGSAKRSDIVPSFAELAYCPPKQEIARIYSSCDVWLFASREEGYGLPILEAMASRTPVIGTPAGAGPELIPQGGGVLVPLNDPKALADQIIRFAQMSPMEWQAFSDRALATAQKHNWTTVSAAFEKALKNATTIKTPEF